MVGDLRVTTGIHVIRSRDADWMRRPPAMHGGIVSLRGDLYLLFRPFLHMIINDSWNLMQTPLIVV